MQVAKGLGLGHMPVAECTRMGPPQCIGAGHAGHEL
jgi:hypothetical protein